MRAIVFGANSQDGYYLRRECENHGIECIGISRSDGDWIRGDVSDHEFVTQVIEYYRPDYLFHLAANSTTRHDAMFENHATIFVGYIKYS